MVELAYKHAHGIRELVRRKEISPKEVAEYFLDRIDRYNESCRAFVCVTRDEALKDAAKVIKWIEEGKTDLQLLGVPIIIDGALRIKGAPFTYCSPITLDNENQDVDVPDVQRLKEAGAIVLGTANTAEFGLTATTINGSYEQVRNPYNPAFSAGGPAGGVATAVAKGLASLGIAPDKHGGARLPASFSGVMALKPTRGRVPIVRRYPFSLLNKAIMQVAPVGRCSRDLAMLLNVLADDAKEDPDRLRTSHSNYETTCQDSISNLKIGSIPQLGKFPVDADVAEVYQRSISLLRTQGFKIEDVSIAIDHEVIKHFCNVFACEHYVPIATLCQNDPEGMCGNLMRGTHRWLNYAKTVSGVAMSMGASHFNILRKKLSVLLQDYDLLITPASPMLPLKLDEVYEEDEVDGCFLYSLKALSYLLLYNMSGHPSLVIPGGVGPSGVPVGINIVSKYCSEELLFQFSHNLQETFGMHGKQPFLHE